MWGYYGGNPYNIGPISHLIIKSVVAFKGRVGRGPTSILMHPVIYIRLLMEEGERVRGIRSIGFMHGARVELATGMDADIGMMLICEKSQEGSEV